jgi:hypothetical protein
MRNLLVTCLGIIAISGCANQGIVKLSPDTYMLSRADRAGVFGNPAAMKTEVIQEANTFAESMGKIAVPITANEVPIGLGRLATFEYQFRVVDKNDPEARGAALVSRPNAFIEKTDKNSEDVKKNGQTERSKDVYADLIKIDDLRKRGILTDAEFETQKRNLLEGK